MSTERFTLQEFKDALPKKKDGSPVFNHIGLHYNEHVFTWNMETMPLRILVRSSIDSTGYAAETGGDSIRIVVQSKEANGEWKSIGKGRDAYTTRVKGWQGRLKSKIAEVFRARVKSITKPVPAGCTVRYARETQRPFAVDANDQIAGWLN